VYAVDPVFYTSHDAPGKQLLVLVESIALEETYASVAFPGTGRRLLALASGAVGAISSQLDPWTGVTQISQLTLQLSNTDGFFPSLPSDFVKSPLRVLLGIGNHASSATMLPLFYGHVESLQASDVTLTVQAVPGAFAWHHDLSTLLGDQFFLDVPQAQRQTAIPLLVGFNRDVDCPPLTTDATGTLAEPLDDATTSLRLKEFAAPFAPTGSLTIGSETGITYTSRSLVTVTGLTYLQLSGLVRPAGVPHLADEAVTGSVEASRYLVGYEATVLSVRVDGVTAPEEDYTVETVEADFPVTVISFATEQGTVTADVDGRNIGDPFTLLPNGDFETGSLSPWTLVGATGSVTTGDAYGGSRKAEVTGGYLTDGSLYQDIDVPPQRGMVLQFAGLRNFEEAGNVILNGDFASNDFTSWTESHGQSPQLTLEPTFLAGPGVEYPPETTLSPLQISETNLFLAWNATLEQTTTAGIGTYRLYIESLFTDFFPVMGSGPLPGVAVRSSGGTGPIGRGLRAAANAYFPPVWGLLTLTVLVHANGTLVYSRELRSHASSTPPSGPYLHGLQTIDQIVTLPSTSVRVRVMLQGQFRGITPTGLSLLKVALIPVNLASIARIALDVGTAAEPQRYGTLQATAPPEAWATYALPLVPTETPLRVTFRTQYDNAAVEAAAWLDQVGIGEQGRNPVEVIRWLIEERIPGLAINEVSFGRAYLARAAWQCGGQWRSPGHSLALLQDLASQFELRYFENGNGEACLVPIDTTALPVASFGPNNATSWQAEREPAVHLATDIYVYYAPRSGQGSQSPADYSGVVSATPEGTTGEPGLATRCATAAAAYKVRETLRVFCTAITDQDTAHLKLREVVLRHTVVGLLVSCTSPLLTIAPLEIGDRVAMTHAIMGELPLIGEVISVAVELAIPTITITARLTETYGSEENYDMPEELLLEGSEEGYEV
jgi:hypothetical protein